MFGLTPQDINLINPNSGTLPIFYSEKDAELAKAIYLRLPVLIRENVPDGNPWGISFLTLFHMATDSEWFRTSSQLEELGFRLQDRWYIGPDGRYVPLFDAKMAQQYNHRAAQLCLSGHQFRKIGQETSTLAQLQNPYFYATPAYWVPEQEVRMRLQDWNRDWLLGFKDVTGVTSTRLASFAIIPCAGVGHPYPLVLIRGNAQLHAILLSVLNSLVIEYMLRLKMQGLHLTYFLLKQLPVPALQQFENRTEWDVAKTVREWLLPRVLELTYTAWDLEPFATDCGYTGPPFCWDEERRFLLCCELDAAYFHLYGLRRDDMDYILEIFPSVKRKDEQAHGEYRTKRVILNIYDTMQQAMETGTPYHTRLDPRPANGWTPPEITLEAVTARQGDRAKEDTAAHSLGDVQQRAAILEIHPKLHFASEG